MTKFGLLIVFKNGILAVLADLYSNNTSVFQEKGLAPPVWQNTLLLLFLLSLENSFCYYGR